MRGVRGAGQREVVGDRNLKRRAGIDGVVDDPPGPWVHEQRAPAHEVVGAALGDEQGIHDRVRHERGVIDPGIPRFSHDWLVRPSGAKRIGVRDRPETHRLRRFDGVGVEPRLEGEVELGKAEVAVGVGLPVGVRVVHIPRDGVVAVGTGEGQVVRLTGIHGIGFPEHIRPLSGDGGRGVTHCELGASRSGQVIPQGNPHDRRVAGSGPEQNARSGDVIASGAEGLCLAGSSQVGHQGGSHRLLLIHDHLAFGPGREREPQEGKGKSLECFHLERASSTRKSRRRRRRSSYAITRPPDRPEFILRSLSRSRQLSPWGAGEYRARPSSSTFA